MGLLSEAWRLIDLEYASGAWNQAVDEALLDSALSGTSVPTIRFYGWNEPCVSIGSSESAADLSVDALDRLGASLVRRNSGGTAVVHHEQIAFALVLPAVHRWALPDITRTYEAIGGVAAGLARELGLSETALASPEEVAAQGRPAGALRAACLAWLAPYELTWRGRKLLGHSQVRRRSCVLHHCVVNLAFDPDRTVGILASAATEHRETLQRLLYSRVGSLSQATGRAVSASCVRGALTEAMRALGAELAAGQLTPAEAADARRLELAKYRDAGWTYRR